MKTLSRVLPPFPRTPHLPATLSQTLPKLNLGEDDIVATSDDALALWGGNCVVEEKIDGASVGMGLYEGEPVIRNRDHILRKGYTKETAAKKQFASIWTWFYKNKQKFEALNDIGSLVVYGEWLIAAHGIHYTLLPDWFIPYDLYDYETGKFLPPLKAREILTETGFNVPTVHFKGTFQGTYDDLEEMSASPSPWTLERSEGIYIKIHNEDTITGRFKMVRSDFRRGFYWNPRKITKNELRNKND